MIDFSSMDTGTSSQLLLLHCHVSFNQKKLGSYFLFIEIKVSGISVNFKIVTYLLILQIFYQM